MNKKKMYGGKAVLVSAALLAAGCAGGEVKATDRSRSFRSTGPE